MATTDELLKIKIEATGAQGVQSLSNSIKNLASSLERLNTAFNSSGAAAQKMASDLAAATRAEKEATKIAAQATAQLNKQQAAFKAQSSALTKMNNQAARTGNSMTKFNSSVTASGKVSQAVTYQNQAVTQSQVAINQAKQQGIQITNQNKAAQLAANQATAYSKTVQQDYANAVKKQTLENMQLFKDFGKTQSLTFAGGSESAMQYSAKVKKAMLVSSVEANRNKLAQLYAEKSVTASRLNMIGPMKESERLQLNMAAATNAQKISATQAALANSKLALSNHLTTTTAAKSATSWKDVSQHLDAMYRGTNFAADGFRTLGSAASTIGSALSNNFRGAASAVASVGGAVVNTAAKAGSAVVRAGISTVEFGAKMGAVGAVATAVVGGQAVAAWGSFEKQMNLTKAVIDEASRSQMPALEQAAMNIGNTTQISATSAAAGIAEMAKAGFNADQILGSLKSMVNLSIAGEMDMGDATNILAGTIRGFGMDIHNTEAATKSANKVVDTLAVTAAQSAIDLSDVGLTFKYVAPMAQAAGFALEDVATATAVMGNNMIRGSQAGTSLRAIMARMSDPPKQAAEAFQELGLQIHDNAGNMRPFNDILTDMRAKFKGLSEVKKLELGEAIAGRYGMSGLLALLNTSQEEFDKLYGAIKDSNGAGQDMADIMGSGLAASFDKLKNVVQSTGIAFGKTLGPGIGKAMVGLRDTIASANPSIVRMGKNMNDALEPFVDGFRGKFINNKDFNNTQQVFGRLGTALSDLKNPFKNYLQQVKDAKKAQADLEKVDGARGFINQFAGIDSLSNTIRNKLNPAIEAAIPKVVRFWATFSPVAIIAKTFEGYVNGGMAGAIKAFQFRFENMTNYLNEARPKFIATVGKYATDATAKLASAAPTIVTGIGHWATALVEWVAPVGAILVNRVAALAYQVIGIITANAPAILGSLGTWAAGFVDWALPVVGALAGQVGKLAITVLDNITKHAPEILDALLAWTEQFMAWAAPLAGKLIEALGRTIQAVLSWIEGNSERLGAAAKRWVEAFGAGLGVSKETIKPFAEGLQGIVEFITGDLLGALQGLIDKAGGVGPALTLAAAGFAAWKLASPILTGVFLALEGGIKVIAGFGKVMAALNITTLLSPIGLIAGAVIALAVIWATNFGDMRDGISDFVATVGDKVADLIETIRGMGITIGGVSNFVANTLDGFKALGELNFGKAFEAWNRDSSDATRNAAKLQNSIDDLTKKKTVNFVNPDNFMKDGFMKQIEQIDKQTQRVQDRIGNAFQDTGSIDNFVSSMQKGEATTRKTTGAAMDFNTVLQMVMGGGNDAAGGLNSFNQSVDNTAAKTDAAKAGIDRLRDAVNGYAQAASKAGQDQSTIEKGMGNIDQRAVPLIQKMDELKDKRFVDPQAAADFQKATDDLRGLNPQFDAYLQAWDKLYNIQHSATTDAANNTVSAVLGETYDPKKIEAAATANQNLAQSNTTVAQTATNVAQSTNKILGPFNEAAASAKNLGVSATQGTEQAAKAQYDLSKKIVVGQQMQVNAAHNTGQEMISITAAQFNSMKQSTKDWLDDYDHGWTEMVDSTTGKVTKVPRIASNEIDKLGKSALSDMKQVGVDFGTSWSVSMDGIPTKTAQAAQSVIDALNDKIPISSSTAKKMAETFGMDFATTMKSIGPRTDGYGVGELPAAMVAKLVEVDPLWKAEWDKLVQIGAVKASDLPALVEPGFNGVANTAQTAGQQTTSNWLDYMGQLLGISQSQTSGVANSVNTNLNQAAQTAQTQGQFVTSSWNSSLSELLGSTQSNTSGIAAAVGTNMQGATTAVQTQGQAMTTAAGTQSQATVDAMKTNLSTAQTVTSAEFAKAQQAMALQMALMVAAVAMQTTLITTGFQTGLSGLGAIAQGAMAQVSSVILSTNLYSAGYAVGFNAGLGLAAGLDATVNLVKDAAARVSSAAAVSAAAALDEHSPSVVMNNIGDYAGQGLVLGIVKNEDAASLAGGRLALAAKDGVEGGSTGMGGSIADMFKGISKEAIDEALKQADNISKIADAAGKMADSLNKLKSWKTIGAVAIDGFSTDTDYIINKFAEIAARFDEKGTKSLGEFADAAGKVADAAGKMADTFGKLKDYSRVAQFRMDEFIADTEQMVMAFAASASKFSADMLAAAQVYADTAGKVADAASKMADSLVKLQKWGVIGVRDSLAFTNDMFSLVADFYNSSRPFKEEMLAAAETYSGTAATVADAAGKMADALGKVRGWGVVGVRDSLAFTNDMRSLVADFYNVSQKFRPDMLAGAESITDTVGKVGEAASKMADALGKMRDWGVVGVRDSLAFTNDMRSLVADFYNGSTYFDEGMLRAASSYAETAGKVADTIGKMAEGLAKIKSWAVVGQVAIDNFAEDVRKIAVKFRDEGLKWDEDMNKAAQNYAETINKVGDALGSAENLSKLKDYKAMNEKAFNQFFEDMKKVADKFKEEGLGWKQEMLDAAKNYSDAAKSVLEAIGAGVENFSKLKTYRGASKEGITAIEEDMKFAVTELHRLTKDLPPEMTAAAKDFGEKTKDFFGAMGDALKVFTDLQEYKGVATSQIRMLIDEMIVALMYLNSQLTPTVMEMATAAAEFGQKCKDIFDGLKSGLEVLKGLEDFKGVGTDQIQNFVGQIIQAVNITGQLSSGVNQEWVDAAQSFLDAAKSIFDKLKDASDAIKDLENYQDGPVNGVQAALNGVINAVSLMGQMVGQSQVFLVQAETFEANMQAALAAVLAGLQAAAAAAAAQGSVPGGGSPSGQGAAKGGFIRGYARGGNVQQAAAMAGGVLVGENGPEIFFPGRAGGYVMNTPMARMHGLLDGVNSKRNKGLSALNAIGNSTGHLMARATGGWIKADPAWSPYYQSLYESVINKGPEYNAEAAEIGRQAWADVEKRKREAANAPKPSGGGGGGGGGSSSSSSSSSKELPSLDSIASALEKLLSDLDKVNKYASVDRTKIDLFKDDTMYLMKVFYDVSKDMQEAQTTSVGNFAEAAGKIADTLGKSLDTFAKLPDYVKPNAATVGSVIDDVKSMMDQFKKVATWKEDEETSVALFADAVDKVVQGVSGALDLFKGLTTYMRVPQANIAAFGDNVEQMVLRVIETTKKVNADLLPATKDLGDAMGSVFGGLSNGLELFKGIYRYRSLNPANMGLFLADIQSVLDQAVAKAPADGSQMKAVAEYYQNVATVFQSLQTALEAIVALSKGTKYIGKSVAPVVDYINSQMGAVNSSTANVVQSGNTASLNGFATGGYVKDNAILVGENGPEIFYPGAQGGYVMNNPMSRMAARSNVDNTTEGSDNRQITIIVQGVSDPARTAALVEKKLKKKGRTASSRSVRKR